MSTLGLYPVSPTARYLPSGLNETQVAALTLSRADHGFPPGESAQSPVGVPYGDPVAPASRSETAARVRRSAPGVTGVEGEYTTGVGFNGIAVGRAR